MPQRRKKKAGNPGFRKPKSKVDGTTKASADAALSSFLGEAKKKNAATRAPAKKTPKLADAWGEVVEMTLRLDPVETAERLTRELSLGEGVTDYPTLRAACDRAASNLFDAKRLEQAARIEAERYESEIEPEIEILRRAARDELVKEHTKGAGRITKDAIRDRMIQGWPDAIKSMERRTSKLRAMAESFKGLVDAWNHRNSQLKIMMERSALGRTR